MLPTITQPKGCGYHTNLVIAGQPLPCGVWKILQAEACRELKNMFLLDDILLAPLKGVVWLCKKINEVAEKEFSDEGLIKEKLMELQLKFELDKISEKEYNKQEVELLARLDALQPRSHGDE